MAEALFFYQIDIPIHRIGHFEINRLIESIILYKFAHY
jgi:hypothetical protein